MLAFSSKPCATQQEIDSAIGFLTALRAADPGGAYPLVPRLRTLLSGRVWEPAEDTRLWEDTPSQIVGFAALTPPDPRGNYLPAMLIAASHTTIDPLRGAMLDWIVDRAQARTAALSGPIATTLSVEADESDHSLHHLLEQRGFDHQSVHICYMARSLADLPVQTEFPSGFTLAEVPPTADLARYQDRYRPLLERWSLPQRQKLARLPDYDPALHLIVETPDGTVAAYCECSFAHSGRSTLTPAIGALDMIATHPELRRRGIGRALLITVLHHLQTVGAEVVSLFTESNNLSAQRLYIALGFQHHRQARIYTRILPPTEATATVIGTAQ